VRGKKQRIQKSQIKSKSKMDNFRNDRVVAEYLISKGASIYAKDKYGRTPLDLERKQKETEEIERLRQSIGIGSSHSNVRKAFGAPTKSSFTKNWHGGSSSVYYYNNIVTGEVTYFFTGSKVTKIHYGNRDLK